MEHASYRQVAWWAKFQRPGVLGVFGARLSSPRELLLRAGNMATGRETEKACRNHMVCQFPTETQMLCLLGKEVASNLDRASFLLMEE